MLWRTLRKARAADARTRIEAVRALATSHRRRAVEQISVCLADPHCDVRAAAVAAVAEQRGREAVPALLGALDDSFPGVRTAAASLLAAYGGADAISAIVPLLGDRYLEVREAAERALNTLAPSWTASPHARLAIPGLLALLGDENRRLAAIPLLGRIRAAEASAPLLALTRESDSAMASQACDALVAIGEPAALVVAADLTHESAEVRAAAGRILTRIGWQPSEAGVASALAVATGAFDRAASMGEIAITPLLKALGEADSERAEQASAALVRLGAAAVKPLITVLPSADPACAARAATALSRIGAPAVEPLVEALAAGDRHNRGALAALLGRIGDPRAVPALVGRLTGERDEVARVVVQALDKLDPAWRGREEARSTIPQLLGQLLHGRASHQGGARVVLAALVDKSNAQTMIKAFVEAPPDNREPLGSLLLQTALVGQPDAPTLMRAFLETPPDKRQPVGRLLDEAGLVGPSDAPALVEALVEAPPHERKPVAWLLERIDPAWMTLPFAADAIPALAESLPVIGEPLAKSLFGQLGPRSADALASVPAGSPASGLAQEILASWGDLRGVVPLAERVAGALNASVEVPRTKQERKRAMSKPPTITIPAASPALEETMRSAGRALLTTGQAGPDGLGSELAAALPPAATIVVRAAIADALLADGCQSGALDRFAVELVAPALLANGYVRGVLLRLLPHSPPDAADQAAARMVAARGLEGPGQLDMLRSLCSMAHHDPSMLDLTAAALTFQHESHDARHSNYSPSMVEGDRALAAVCATTGSLSTELLRLVARQANFHVDLPCCDLPPTRYEIDFSERRAVATEELRKRGLRVS
jgi:HEAT repeat protein